MRHFVSSVASLFFVICFLFGSPSPATAWFFFFWVPIPKEAPPNNKPSTPQQSKGSAQWRSCISQGEIKPELKIESCTAAINSGSLNEPQLAFAYTVRGIAWNAKGDLDRSIADYDAALHFNPKLAFAFGNRGNARTSKGDLDGAISDYDTAIQLNAKTAITYVNRGVAYAKKGDYDRAIADYDEAIRLDPKFALAYNNRGTAYRTKGDYDRAIADYSEAIRINPLPGGNAHINVYDNRGVAYSAKKDFDHAISDFSEAIRLDPKYAISYVNRGNAYANKGDRDRAIADFDGAIRLDPNYATAHYNRGFASQAKGDYDRAIANCSEAIRLDPGYTAAYTCRGLAYEKKGDFERAKIEYNAALALPQKFSNGKWAHDTARKQLASLVNTQQTSATVIKTAAAQAREKCVAIWSDHVFDPIRDKFPLGQERPTISMLTNSERIRPEDKPLADLAVEALKKCRDAYGPVLAMLTPKVNVMIDGLFRKQDALIAELYTGKITIGEYNVAMNRAQGDFLVAISTPESPAPLSKDERSPH